MDNKKRELTQRIYELALQSPEILENFLELLGYSYDPKTSTKNKKFFFSYSGQKTGSINVFLDKRTGNYIFYDFASDRSGNIFSLLEEYGIKNGKLLYLAENYPSLFGLTNQDIESIRQNNSVTMIEKHLIKQTKSKLNQLKSKKRKESFAKRKTFIIDSENCFVNDLQYLTVSRKENTFLRFDDLFDYLTKERKLNPYIKIFAVKLALKLFEKDELKTTEYYSGITIPYGIFSFNELKKLNSDKLKKLLLDEGCEIRVTQPILGNLKSYSKVNYSKELRKTPTIFYNESSSNVLIFESLFDYYSIANYLDNKINDIIILNGASMDGILIDLLKANQFKKKYENMIIFTQNDKAGNNLSYRLIKNNILLQYLSYDKVYLFTYKPDEVKCDINDLIKAGKIKNIEDIQERFMQVSTKKHHFSEEQKEGFKINVRNFIKR